MMTKEEAAEFFSILFKGEHHVPRGGIHPCGVGWCVNAYDDLSTFDSDLLTRFVFLAHDQCVRAAVKPSGPWMVKLAIWKRQRHGGISEKHPDLEQAVAEWREWHPKINQK